MKEKTDRSLGWILPGFVFLILLSIWQVLSALHLFQSSVFPSPLAVTASFVQELRSARLWDDLIASLWRVSTGFLLAVIASVPMGLLLGSHARLRTALLPAVNFFRNLSPLAWIPFAILWFGVGDAPSIFLIFLSCYFPMVLSVTAASANIPAVHFQVAREYGLKETEMLTRVVLPAIMPQFITTLRVTAGVAWMVVVAAEMIAGKDGLGFMIWDSRNGLRTDLLVCGMIVIGIIGVVIDRLLLRLTQMPSVRWGYER